MSHPLARTTLHAAALVALALPASTTQPASYGRIPRLATAVPDTLATLSAGGGSTCLTTTNGAAWCWGALGYGHRGPFRITGVGGQPAVLRSLSPWGWHACGLDAVENIVCDAGLTGAWLDSAGKTTAIPEPCRSRACVAPLPLRGALPPGSLRAVTTGSSHECALALNGTAFCWGRNDMGQLGNGARAADSTGGAGEVTRVPTAVVGGLRFAQLDAGEDFTCGVTEPDGAIYCWGYGQSGQTGGSAAATSCSGTRPHPPGRCRVATQTRVLPESLPGDHIRPGDVRFSRVSAGMRLACGIDVAGVAYCWGNNYRCALGRCRSPNSPRAHRIPMSGRVVEIGAGYMHSCARTADGRIFCWGNNAAGQLGSFASVNAGPDGLPPDYRDGNAPVSSRAAYDDPCFLGGRCSPAPVEVSPGRRWAALAVGGDHACALALDDGGIYCWGGGDSTALGGAALQERCINRSAQWPDVRCQATPVRVSGLPPLAPAARARSNTAPEPVRVRVSRHELRVSFPPDTARAWGWSERQDPRYDPRYEWRVLIDGMDGPRSLAVRIGRTRPVARDFSSLERLVEAARVENCGPGMFVQCSDSGLRAAVEGGRVVLTLRDSAQIARLFGLRPTFVHVSQHRPEEEYRLFLDSVPVEYVAPQIPAPDSATRADAARSRRRYLASITRIVRYIAAGDNRWGPLWLVVGDSAATYVDEMRCSYDLCATGFAAPDDSGWTIVDPRVARLQPAAPDTSHDRRILLPRRATMYVKALRPGRTALRVQGVHGTSDTAASSRPPARVVEREIVVTLPIGRVEITPRPDTVRAHEPFTLSVRVLDRTGREAEGVPARLEVLDGDRQNLDASRPVPLTLGAPGRTRIVARLGVHSDTVTVTVVDSLAPTPRRR